MRGDIPVPGSTKAKLIEVGIQLFSQEGYEHVDVDRIAAEAGVTVGSLYHHFSSKKQFYGLLRDDLTQRILDRMEAAAESVPRQQALKAALLAAYDGVLRIKAGKLLTEDDPRGDKDAIARFLGQVAAQSGRNAGELLGMLLAAALRAALIHTIPASSQAREALASLLAEQASDVS